jgi:sensor domain CHASE-containing protein
VLENQLRCRKRLLALFSFGEEMQDRINRRWSVYIFIILISSFAIGLVEVIDRSQKNFLRDSLLGRAKEELSIIRSELEAAIVSDIFAVNSISVLRC